MTHEGDVSVHRVVTDADFIGVVSVLDAIYRKEKGWVLDAEGQAPASDRERDDVSWFLASVEGAPVGVLRVLYTPPIEQYAKYQFRRINPKFSIKAYLRDKKFVEIGRFAVTQEYRARFTVATALMQAATHEIVDRGFTHLLTDVFEDDPHSPYGFHTRIMGFHPVATHDRGELRSTSRRITLVLDLKAAYKRLKSRGGRLFRLLTRNWDVAAHRRMAV
ncbi:GNAT family N-acetyltransferase [Terrarubrum flagellatum]|uniref:GNAT family N-acetyltransferase n=1 Tax=Terrirubrum flagellatum TaxID=2895980 RepID=UPI0031454A83